MSFVTSSLQMALFVGLLMLPSAQVTGATTATVPQVLNIGNGAEPKDLDPHMVTGVPEFHILMNIFEGLVIKDPKNLDPVPGAAESWTISKDAKVYSFKIRKNAKWSNGDPVTAEDFVFSFTRLLNPATASEYANYGYHIKNGKQYNTKEIPDASKLGLKAIDSNTLEITLENPVPFFLALLAHHSFLPVPRKTIEKFGVKWTRPENIVTNGTFVPAEWEVNKIVRVKPNPNYWDRASVKLTEVNYYPTERDETDEKMFRSKEVHITNEVPLEKIPFWQKEKSKVYRQHPWLGVYYYTFNLKRAPFNNPKVRRAINYAIDRLKIVNLVTRGGQIPATVFTPPGTGGYQPIPRLPKDLSRLAEAKKLLTEAGYPDGKGLPALELLYNTLESHKKIAEAIQEMLKVNLGLNVKLVNQEWKVYLNSQREHDFMFTRQGWIGDYNDPDTFLSMFVTGNELNHAQFSNSKFDELIVAAGKELNAKKRLDIFQKAEDILLDELPVMPIYIYTRVYLKAPNIVGWHENIEDYHPLKYVSLSGKW